MRRWVSDLPKRRPRARVWILLHASVVRGNTMDLLRSSDLCHSDVEVSSYNFLGLGRRRASSMQKKKFRTPRTLLSCNDMYSTPSGSCVQYCVEWYAQSHLSQVPYLGSNPSLVSRRGGHVVMHEHCCDSAGGVRRYAIRRLETTITHPYSGRGAH